jgi:hypothetical protein
MSAQRPSLVVLDAECAHGGQLARVNVRRDGTQWLVEGSYRCSHECRRAESRDAQPVSVVDTNGGVRWPSMN